MCISVRVFLRYANNKMQIWYAYFSGIYKDLFLQCGGTRLLGVGVMLFAFETAKLGSVLSTSKI